MSNLFPNNVQHSTPKLLRNLWQHITPNRRKQLALLLVLMVITSITEVISIGAVIPFLGVLTAPEQVFSHPLAQPFIEYLQFTSSDQLILPLAILFGSTAILAGATRLLLVWASVRLAFLTGSDLSINIYNRTLFQPYSVHTSRNSSEVINAIATKSHAVIYQTLLPVLTIASSILILVVVLVALFSIATEMALMTLAGFGGIYTIIIILTRKRLLINSQRVAQDSTLVIKTLQEGLGGIRDIIIDNSQKSYCSIYKNIELRVRKAQGEIEFISSSPRFLMESLGMLLIAIIAYIQIRRSGDISSVIPLLGVLALSAQRLLPVLQQVYSALSNMRGSKASLEETLDFLNQSLLKHIDYDINPLAFRREISINNLSFQHTVEGPMIFKNINLTIKKGDRVGFIGDTGSGKSTLLDLIMGLLQPSKGTLDVDGYSIRVESLPSWQAHIAHVPQTVFPADTTIVENIAFGVDKINIDYDKVVQAATQAQISSFINNLPDKYQTTVGERGVKISGGQRQRIGIARALYKQADVIVFDEATSALDEQTEREVMKSIDSIGNNITLLIIAHRLSTLKNCNKLVKIVHNNVEVINDVNHLIEKNKEDKLKRGMKLN